MCQESKRVSSFKYCTCLENNKEPTSNQRLLLEKYIPVFKLFLRQGPHPKVVHYFQKADLLVLLDFFSKQGNAIRFSNESEVSLDTLTASS